MFSLLQHASRCLLGRNKLFGSSPQYAEEYNQNLIILIFSVHSSYIYINLEDLS